MGKCDSVTWSSHGLNDGSVDASVVRSQVDKVEKSKTPGCDLHIEVPIGPQGDNSVSTTPMDEGILAYFGWLVW